MTTTTIPGFQARCRVCGPLGPSNRNLEKVLEEIQAHSRQFKTPAHKGHFYTVRIPIKSQGENHDKQ